MKFLATVCGGDVRWAVPVTTDDAQSMLATLMGHEPSEQALDTDVTHLLLVTRPEWAPAMRRLATLLRAQEPTLGVAVLETGHTPLAAAACVSEVHQHDLEPGAAARAVRDLLERHPGLVLVIAHMGMPDYGDFLDIAAENPDVHLDTTMAFTDFTEEATPFPRERMEDLHALGDRVLFGSDFPNIPYPYEHAVDTVVDLGLGDEWVRGVLHDNAARLLRL